MQSIRYLAYGSNLHPARIGARIGSITKIGSTEIPGWALCYHKLGEDGSGKCNLIADGSRLAYGVVYEISLDNKHRLDQIEGVGRGYIDSRIELPSLGEAHVYLAESSHIDESLIPYDWYHAFVLRGAELNKFPAAYIAEIHAVGSLRDPREDRRAENMAIANSIAIV